MIFKKSRLIAINLSLYANQKKKIMPWPKALHCEQTKTKNKNTANYESQFFVFETPTQSRCGTWRGKVITDRAHATLFFCAMSTTSFLNPEPPVVWANSADLAKTQRRQRRRHLCAHYYTAHAQHVYTARNPWRPA